MIQKLLSPTSWSASATDWASLILRLTFGLLMLSHGIPKMMKLMNGNMEFGDPIGIGVPASLTLAVILTRRRLRWTCEAGFAGACG